MEQTQLKFTDVVAFLVELAALGLLAAWGFRTGGPATKYVLSLGLPAVAIVLWGLFAAPRARYDVPALKAVVVVLVLGGGALAAFGVLPVGPAAVLAAVMLASAVISYVLPSSRARSAAAAQGHR